MFNWNELTLLKYNPSEFNGWYSAPALDSVVSQLNNESHNGEVRIIAHSQGNIPAGEFMRTTSQNVHSYIATQAAIPTRNYSNSDTNIYVTNPRNPDIYGHWTNGSTDDPYMNDNTTNTDIYRYYNRSDWALDWWEVNNNKLKGYGGGSQMVTDTKVALPLMTNLLVTISIKGGLV
ncbi:MAG: alpha/beta hydrolase [Planctomycetes bacterium]|nr:alpha/beta hydrolase [Planctomycetota bacterium]